MSQPTEELRKYYLAIDVGKVNMGYAIYDGESFGFNVFSIEDHISKDNKDKPTKYYKIEVLDKWITNLLKQYNIVKVIIEQQVINNVGATIIQTIIESLFFVRNIPVEEYPAINKFKYLHPQYDSKKKEHKKISTQYAKNIISHHGYALDNFNKFKKKDDISDATCMVFMTWWEDRNDRDMILRYLK